MSTMTHILVAELASKADRAKQEVKRVDPVNCGCTDCTVERYSVPLDLATDEQLLRLVREEADNATGLDWNELLEWVRKDRGL